MTTYASMVHGMYAVAASGMSQVDTVNATNLTARARDTPVLLLALWSGNDLKHCKTQLPAEIISQCKHQFVTFSPDDFK